MPLGGAYEKTGGHKGYGFAMLCEIFSSVLSMGTPSSSTGAGGRGLICHGFAAIDPSVFGDPEAIRAHFSDYLEKLRTSALAEGAERIYTHGEKEARRSSSSFATVSRSPTIPCARSSKSAKASPCPSANTSAAIFRQLRISREISIKTTSVRHQGIIC